MNRSPPIAINTIPNEPSLSLNVVENITPKAITISPVKNILLYPSMVQILLLISGVFFWILGGVHTFHPLCLLVESVFCGILVAMSTCLADRWFFQKPVTLK